MRLRRLIPILMIVSVFSACEKTDGIMVFHPTSSEGWTHKDSLQFSIPEVTKEQDYELSVNVRIDNRYAYQDLWLVINQTYETHKPKPTRSYTTIERREIAKRDSIDTFVPRHQHFCDTIRLQMIDTKKADANFTGTGRNLITYHTVVRSIHLIRHEQGTISLRHIMDEDSLRSIHDVGISFLPK